MIQIQNERTKHLLNVNCINNYECVVTCFIIIVIYLNYTYRKYL